MTAWLEETLIRVSTARVAVFGDFALDAYWDLADDDGEISLETGEKVRKVRTQSYGPGGAGNIAANLAALGVVEVHAVGLLGDDLFGASLLTQLENLSVHSGGLLRCQDSWQTPVFTKPQVRGVEQSRIDFGAFNEMDSASIDRLVEQIDHAATHCDVVVLNQQIPKGVTTSPVIERLNKVITNHPRRRFLADSRHRPGEFTGAMLKINATEARTMYGADDEETEFDHIVRQLQARIGHTLFVTHGPEGIWAADADGLWHEPAIPITAPTDTVGAGDAAVAAIAAALAAGATPQNAARLANLAAAVTVTKLQTTGTATPDEISALASALPS